MVKGLSGGLLFSHLCTQTAGSRMLLGEDKRGLPQASWALASELDQVCGWALLAPLFLAPVHLVGEADLEACSSLSCIYHTDGP